jgi:hypothetical protein
MNGEILQITRKLCKANRDNIVFNVSFLLNFGLSFLEENTEH